MTSGAPVRWQPPARLSRLPTVLPVAIPSAGNVSAAAHPVAPASTSPPSVSSEASTGRPPSAPPGAREVIDEERERLGLTQTATVGIERGEPIRVAIRCEPEGRSGFCANGIRELAQSLGNRLRCPPAEIRERLATQ